MKAAKYICVQPYVSTSGVLWIGINSRKPGIARAMGRDLISTARCSRVPQTGIWIRRNESGSAAGAIVLFLSSRGRNNLIQLAVERIEYHFSFAEINQLAAGRIKCRERHPALPILRDRGDKRVLVR